MMKTGKNKRLLASILAASMLLAMSPFALAEGTEGTTGQEQSTSQPAEVKTEGSGIESGSGSESSGGSESTGSESSGGSESTGSESSGGSESTGSEGSGGGESAAGSVQLLPAAPVEETGAEENALTAVPEDKLSFDQGVIKGINATWLAENKDKPLSVAIPAEINDTPVTSIGQNAFKAKNAGLENHPQVAAVDFSNAANLKKIDNQAFQDSPVTSVDLSKTKVTTIGKFAFGDCTSLETFIFPDTLKSLGNSEGASVFTDCKSLKIMRLANSPEGVVFALPETLTYIGKYTFKNCFADGVEAKVVIPASVATLGEGAFYDKHITQIIFEKTVDPWKDENYSGYDSSAMTPPSGCDRIIVLPDYKCFVAYSTQVEYGSKLQKICTYPIKITFSPLGIQEKHLNHALLGWTYNSATKLWDFNNNYKLPDTNGATTGGDRPGYEYVGGWKLSSSNQVLNENEKLEATDNPFDRATVSGEYKLANPTISYLVDGKSKPVDADQPFTVTIGDGKEHTLGVQVSHPLLLSEQGNKEGEYVYFEYCWWDEGYFADNGTTMTVNGPRSTEEPELFSTAETDRGLHRVWVKDNTIPITKTNHARTDHNYYLVEICGYIVKNGNPVPFYQSSNNFIHFGFDEDIATVRNYYTLQVNVDEVRIITATADDNGKITPAGDVAVPKGKNQTFTITPNEGYHIQDVKVDRESVGAVKEYTFKEVTASHTIHATFARNSSGGGGGGGGRKPTVTIPDDVPTGLNGDDHYAYIVGYPNGNVEPNGNITRAEVATIFFRLLTEKVRTANSTQSNSLSDVTRGQWFNHAVSTLSSMGIVKGHNDGTFAPNAPITRAEFAAIAARFDDKNRDTSSKFTDIASHWAKNEIGIAANKGWINGYPDGTFRPNQYITRAEAMTLVNRVLNRLPENSSDLLNSMIKWPDNSDASAWYYLAVQEATNSHYYKTKENKFEKWTELRKTRDWTELEK